MCGLLFLFKFQITQKQLVDCEGFSPDIVGGQGNHSCFITMPAILFYIPIFLVIFRKLSFETTVDKAKKVEGMMRDRYMLAGIIVRRKVCFVQASKFVCHRYDSYRSSTNNILPGSTRILLY